MNFTERQNLGHNIKFLNMQQIKGIVNIMKDIRSPNSQVLEFDLNVLPDRKCRELEQYVKKCLQEQ